MSPRVFPGWVLENFKLVAAGKPSGHSNLGLDRSSEVPLRAAGWRAQKQRVVPNFCETRPSIRYVNYSYGNLDTTVPRCLFGSGPAVALMGGVLGGRRRSERFCDEVREDSLFRSPMGRTPAAVGTNGGKWDDLLCAVIRWGLACDCDRCGPALEVCDPRGHNGLGMRERLQDGMASRPELSESTGS